MRRSREPLLWSLFSGGGMLAAFTLPAIVFLFWVATPLGWVDVTYARVAGLALHPIGRLCIFALVTLSLFHWAHRFRYTLYDGLQLYHLNRLIAVLTYGLATAATVVAGYLVLG